MVILPRFIAIYLHIMATAVITLIHGFTAQRENNLLCNSLQLLEVVKYASLDWRARSAFRALTGAASKLDNFVRSVVFRI